MAIMYRAACLLVIVLVQVCRSEVVYGDQLTTIIPTQGGSSAHARIAGGSQAAPGMFPWHVALTTNDGALHCSGALVTQQWVLTAAWCVQGFESLTVILGAWDLQDPDNIKLVVNASDIVIHPDYVNSARVNDLALIKVETVFLTQARAVLMLAIRLPHASLTAQSLDMQQARLSGFGATSTSSAATPRYLRWVELAVLSNADCSAALPDSGVTLTNSMMCTAGAMATGPCENDRGGALVTQVDGQWTVVGILNYLVDAACTSGHPAVYTRVASHVKWIETTTGSTAAYGHVDKILLLVALVVGRRYC